MTYPERIFTEDEEARIVDAIRAFEARTSGELRVHVEHRLRRPPLDEAIRVFAALEMNLTAERNGVLLLLAPAQRSFAIFGDVGIDAVTPPGFWDAAAAAMRSPFAEGRFVEGLTEGIRLAGEALAEHFPRRDDDVNELPDEISYGR